MTDGDLPRAFRYLEVTQGDLEVVAGYLPVAMGDIPVTLGDVPSAKGVAQYQRETSP